VKLRNVQKDKNTDLLKRNAFPLGVEKRKEKEKE
jgi:hypothetical protein